MYMPWSLKCCSHWPVSPDPCPLLDPWPPWASPHIPVQYAPLQQGLGSLGPHKYCWGGGEFGTLCTVGGNVNWCSHYGKQYGGSSKKKKKIKDRMTIWSSYPTFGFISKITESKISKWYLHTHVHSCTIHSSQEVEKPKHPLMDERIKKMWYIIYTF